MLSDAEVAEAINVLRWQHVTFESRENRDQVWSALRKDPDVVIDGQVLKIGDVKVRRSSMRNQLLWPGYTFEGRSTPDLGLGNSSRMYGVLYSIEPQRW